MSRTSQNLIGKSVDYLVGIREYVDDEVPNNERRYKIDYVLMTDLEFQELRRQIHIENSQRDAEIAGLNHDAKWFKNDAAKIASKYDLETSVSVLGYSTDGVTVSMVSPACENYLIYQVSEFTDAAKLGNHRTGYDLDAFNDQFIFHQDRLVPNGHTSKVTDWV